MQKQNKTKQNKKTDGFEFLILFTLVRENWVHTNVPTWVNIVVSGIKTRTSYMLGMQ